MFPLKTIDFIDYICSDPEKVLSGASRAYRRLYREYINHCKKETFNANLGIIDEALMIQKRYLSTKIFKLKKVIPVNKDRVKFRMTESYLVNKRKLFLTKVNTF